VIEPVTGVSGVPEVLPTGGASSNGGGAATTDDSDVLRVIMGHPGLRAPGHVSLPEVMGTTHFALRQAHDVLQREWGDIKEERHCLTEWGSLLKK
jgi:hypothetical protein